MSKITIELTENEIEVACQTLLNDLRTEWDNDEDEYLKAVSAWRAEFAPNFVEEQQRYQGSPGSLNWTRDQAQQFLYGQTQIADLLEKLAKQLPTEEVANA